MKTYSIDDVLACTVTRVKAIYYGCANDKFGGCGSVGNLVANMADLGQLQYTHFYSSLADFVRNIS